MIDYAQQHHRNRPTPAQQQAAERFLVALCCVICGFTCGLVLGLLIGSWK